MAGRERRPQIGPRIIDIKHTKKQADLTATDYAHMRKSSATSPAISAQGGPADKRQHRRWRYSLMNWGHDPLK